MVVFLLAYAVTFSEQICLRRNHFFTLLQSNYFDTTVTFMKQLFLQSCWFYLEASFFWTVTSSHQSIFQNSYFFRAKLLPSSHFLSYLLGQVLFGKQTFFWRNCSNKDIFRRSTFLNQVLRRNFFRRPFFPQ